MAPPASKIDFTAVVLTVLVILTPRPALAYLDPGTGAMLLQLLFGGVAGALVLVKLYWTRLKGLFVGQPRGQDDHGEGVIAEKNDGPGR